MVDGLTRRFGPVVALSGVSFVLRWAGRAEAVVEPNGAGKVPADDWYTDGKPDATFGQDGVARLDLGTGHTVDPETFAGADDVVKPVLIRS